MINWINSTAKEKPLIIILIGCLFSVIISSPHLDLLLKIIITNEFPSHWNTILAQSNDLTYTNTLPPETHDAKKAFRIFLPILCKYTGISILGLYLIQVCLSILSAYLVFVTLRRITLDNKISLGLSLVFLSSYAGLAGFVDIYGWGDAYAFFFLALAAMSKNTFICFLSIALGAMVDERAFISSSFILILRSYEYKNELLKQVVVPIAGAWIVYLGIRLYLWQVLSITQHTGALGINVLESHLVYYIPAMASALKALLAPIFIAFVYCIFYIGKFRHTMFIISILASLIVGVMVYDLTRANAYIFPAVFPALIILKDTRYYQILKERIGILILVSFLVPIIMVVYDVFWVKSVLIQIFSFI